MCEYRKMLSYLARQHTSQVADRVSVLEHQHPSLHSATTKLYVAYKQNPELLLKCITRGAAAHHTDGSGRQKEKC